ncbi:MAG TPA: DUF4147 domain-containing protein [Candidatus Binatia bacterium]|nr:DUF4147 domain-containing protein [Candidatus Binatia bacterium]
MDARTDAGAAFRAALARVAPGPLVRERLARDAGALVLRDARGAAVGRHAGPVLIVGAGKAALDMARAAADAVGAWSAGGVVVVPHAAVGPCGGGVEVLGARHPVPDEAGVRASMRLVARVASADATALVLVCLSGGASSLLEVPAAGLALADVQALGAALLATGMDVGAMNVVRKHCSAVKGGLLARAAARAAGVWTLVLSDVVGDDLAAIGSGPTVPDPSTFADALAALDASVDPAGVPPRVRAHLVRGAAGAVPETPKPGDGAFARAHTVVVGGNRDAVAAAAAAVRERGWDVDVVPEPLLGPAEAAGPALAARLLVRSRDRAVAVVAGGETTVRAVAGGRGGRCQQLALAAAAVVAGTPAVLLAAGTDGVDGPTDAAGALVDGGTLARAAAAGRDAGRALATTDAYSVLAAAGDLLRTGPTGTNVGDLVVALRPAC